MTPEEQIDRAATFIAQLASIGSITVDVGQDSADKLEFLRRAGRDFFASTPELRNVARKAAADAARGRAAGLDARKVQYALVQAIRGHILTRFASNGGDVKMAPLLRETIKRKLAKGQPSLIGIATRSLLNELRARPWRVRGK